MKTASLRFGVVILLSLLAGRARAQLDSNAMVTVYCQPTGDFCTMTVTHAYNFGGSDTGSDIFSSYQSLGVGPIGPFRYSGGDSVYLEIRDPSGRLEGVQFNVDTTNKMFRKLTLSNYFDNNIIDPCVFNYGGFQSLVARLDSLPYTDSSGILFAHGAFTLILNFTAKVACAISNHQGLTGFCEDSSTTEIDTLSIEIIPNGYLNVTQAGTMPEKRSISILEKGSELLVSTFRISEDVHTLEVYDLLGRHAAMIEISSNAESVELPTMSLLPGCYFARLGDQVAKFVVPPR